MWGTRANGREQMDKIHLMYPRSVLGIKTKSSNIITLGECGSIPPSVTIQAICLMYLMRIQSLPEYSILKQTFNETRKMHNLGFDTWSGRVCELAKQISLEVDGNYTKREIKLAVAETFKMHWHSKLNDVTHNPILRTYTHLKAEFCIKPHLSLVTNYEYRDAVTKLRTSSHTLEVEMGRYTNPKTSLGDRLCSVCGIIEDELHFLVRCRSYAKERQELFEKISNLFPQFQHMDNTDEFVFMLC